MELALLIGTPAYLVYFIPILLLVATITSAVHTLQKPVSRLPGPWHSKWTGIVSTYYWLTGRDPTYIHYLHNKYGPIVRISPDKVDISDLDAAREIHSLKGGFIKSEWYQKVTVTGTGTVFNTTDIEFHRRHRRLLSHPLSESGLKSLEPVIQERARLAIRRISEEMEIRGAADVLKWWLFMATDVIGELSFGESFRILDVGKKNQYIHDLEAFIQVGNLRATFPHLVQFSRDVFPLPFFNQVVAVDDRTMKYGEESIQRYKRNMLTEPDNHKPTLFSKLFKPGDEGLSKNEIRDEAQAYIIAGSDTTANSLTYLIWAVCRHPRIKARLLKEIETTPEEASGQDLKALPYLNQVVEEALRLYGAIPAGLPRIVPPGGVNMAGYYLPGGMTVTTQAYSLHRNSDVFPRPDEFDPDRWAAPTKEMKDSSMPFGAGSRICLGMHLARMELRLGTVLFFRAFPNAKVSNLEGMSDKDMEGVIFFIQSPKGKRCLIQRS